MMRTLATAWAVGVVMGAGAASGQESTRVVPGAGVLELSRLEPFEAEYDQFGTTMHVRLARENTATGSWGFTMENAGPMGTSVDHVVHGADALAFERRNFGYGAFRDEYLEVSEGDGHLSVRRMSRDEAEVVDRMEYPLSEPVVDGTFLYWALGLLQLEEGSVYTFPTWSPTAEGAVLRESGSLEVVGTETFDAGVAGQVVATVLEAAVGDGRVRMLVVPHAPYLLRQEAIDAAGDTTVLVELRTMRRPIGSADARRAMAAASRQFSRAYVDGDVGTVRSLYTEDARLLPPGGLVEGRESIGRYFAPNARRTTLSHRMTAEARTVEEGHAIEIGTWHQLVRDEVSGDLRRSSERYMLVWRRQLDGEWRISEDMWHRPTTASPPPPVHVAPRVEPGLESAAGARAGGDWSSDGAIPIGDDASDARQGSSEITGDRDLSLAFRTAWDTEALSVRVQWTDDVVDQAVLGGDEGLWTRPDGENRDRMYFYDNLQIRFWLPDRFVGIWVAPREGPAFQWARVDPEGGERRFVDVEAQGVAVDGAIQIEVRVPWEILGVDPEPGLALDVQLVAPDSDFPTRSLEEKEATIDWRAWRAPIVLGER